MYIFILLIYRTEALKSKPEGNGRVLLVVTENPLVMKVISLLG